MNSQPALQWIPLPRRTWRAQMGGITLVVRVMLNRFGWVAYDSKNRRLAGSFGTRYKFHINAMLDGREMAAAGIPRSAGKIRRLTTCNGRLRMTRKKRGVCVWCGALEERGVAMKETIRVVGIERHECCQANECKRRLGVLQAALGKGQVEQRIARRLGGVE